MKEPANLSPFAALSPREQKEQWIWWQCQKAEPELEVHPPKAEPAAPTAALPELRLPQKPPEDEPHETTQAAPRAPMAYSMVPTIRHGQYDAVIRRMKDAGRMASNYTPWIE